MKILFYLSRYPGVGGIENVTSQIVKSMLDEDVSVSIISHLHEETPDPELNKIKMYYMPDYGKYYTKANKDYLESVLKENMFDAIVYQDSYAPTEKIVCPLAQKYNVRLYVFEHNSPLFIYNKRELDPLITVKGFLRRVLHQYLLFREKRRKSYLLRNCTRYVLLSQRYIPEFCKLLGIKENSKITFINNPSIQNDSPIQDKENIILCVSRLAKEKRIDKVLYIWKQIHHQLQDWRLIIVGDGPERDKLLSYVVNINIPRIEFTGYRDPNEFYSKAKIFVMTSKYEGWPLTLVEAMQHGCVPIAWNSFSSIYDIIDNEQNGVIVSNNDVSEFECSLLSLARNQTAIKRFSESAQKKAEEFEIKRIYKQWLQLFK